MLCVDVCVDGVCGWCMWLVYVDDVCSWCVDGVSGWVFWMMCVHVYVCVGGVCVDGVYG